MLSVFWGLMSSVVNESLSGLYVLAMPRDTAIIHTFWLWQFFGRLHPLIVHFPIGLLLVGLLLELFTLNKRNQYLRRAIHIILTIGSVSAVLAATFGWLLEEQDQYSGDVLTVHKWSGIATAVLATLTVVFHLRIFQRGMRSLLPMY